MDSRLMKSRADGMQSNVRGRQRPTYRIIRIRLYDLGEKDGMVSCECTRLFSSNDPSTLTYKISESQTFEVLPQFDFRKQPIELICV